MLLPRRTLPSLAYFLLSNEVRQMILESLVDRQTRYGVTPHGNASYICKLSHNLFVIAKKIHTRTEYT
ncbi:uncharacterized protein PHALS_15221 [Plasmopara halstedii]|uniref:Uncharacterized protein n=1 Tax=Plasmopara halstedii TaxID=4781 RepID=A0A0N7L8D7_PLAHL|nr:uncharacterized protein PHALS_15221 [Plasmopara halstedii]CEG49587.1 hypothetical protein PHALS_15221 [Plasmopara halstedii]|eukprot:XP_024585956.1 hypothetical protein PHALS_15221 [Plasmopara halstedii]